MADNVFTPAMLEGGWMAPIFGRITGTGAGAGISVIFIISGVIAALIAGFAYVVPAVRNAEMLLPDHDAAAA